MKSKLDEIKARARRVDLPGEFAVMTIRLVAALELAVSQRDETGSSWDDYHTHDKPKFDQALLKILEGAE